MSGERQIDAVVIGSGVNGLVAACVLGRAGRNVVVLEASPHIGGLAASVEFHPGYRSGGVLHDTAMVRPAVVAGLSLERHGLELRKAAAPVLACGASGASFLDALPADEAERLAALRRFLDRLAPVLAGFSDQAPVDVLALEAESKFELLRRGLRLRRLGKKDMLELMRIAPMCLADFLDEWLEDDAVKAALALPAVAASFTAPRSPGTTANFLLLDAMTGPGTTGGSHALVAALREAAKEARVEIRTSAAVSRIEVTAGVATGVTLADGSSIEAPLVAAACDPRTALLDLVEPMHLSVRLDERLESYRCRGTTAQLLLALEGPLEITGVERPLERLRIAADLVDIERAFDPIKYRELPARPVLDVAIPSAQDAALCPTGHAVVSVLAHFAPPDPIGGWTDEARGQLTGSIIDRLAEHAPQIRDRLAAAVLRTPDDLARDLRLAGGNLHHGERALDQILVRPTPECSSYATPIEGLFLCGGGTHPGGGLHGGCGWLAGAAMTALS